MTFSHPKLTAVTARYLSHGIALHLTPKPVKNINFRLKEDGLHVSFWPHVRPERLADLLNERLAWAVAHRRPPATSAPATLWGEPCHFSNLNEKLTTYRHALEEKIPLLQAKWQPIVGKHAKEIRIKKMHTRFGTCNSTQARIWLSLYLPAFSYECTEYVFVHELCHLHHADHSPRFWQAVRDAMPDYQRLHNHLKQQNLRKVGL